MFVDKLYSIGMRQATKGKLAKQRRLHISTPWS
jgi:hypothetical protein